METGITTYFPYQNVTNFIKMYNRHPISSYYTAFASELESTVLRNDSKILEKNADELVADLLLKSGHSLQPIEFDGDRKETMKHRKEMRRVPAHHREDFHQDEGDTQFEYESIDVTLPIKENDSISILKTLEPSTRSLSWSTENVDWYPNYISFSVDIKGYGFKYDDNSIANLVATEKNRINEWVGWVNADIERGKSSLKESLVNFINARRQKLKEDQGRISSLSEKMGITLEE